MSEIECADRERRDDDDERPQAPERDHQAGQEQQVVGALQDVPEAVDHEPQRGLVPAGIEADQSRIAVELERARGAVRRQEAQRGRDFEAEPVDARVDGEFRAVRADRVVEQHVEELLVPVELEVVGERRPLDMRARLLVGGERPVGGERDPRLDDPRGPEAGVVLVKVDAVDEPELRCIAQRLVGARQVEIARPAGRKLDLAHGGERHADQELQPVADRPHEGVDLDVGRDLVGARVRRDRACERRGDRQGGVPRYVDQSQAMQETLPGYALRYGHLGGRYKPAPFCL